MASPDRTTGHRLERKATRHGGTVEHRVDVRVPPALALCPPVNGMEG